MFLIAVKSILPLLNFKYHPDGMEIHKIFIKRIGFNLIRVHRQQLIATSLSENKVLLQNLKWPVEALFVGMRPASQKLSLRDWHRFTKVDDVQFAMGRLATTASTFAGSFTWPGVTPTSGSQVVSVTPTFVEGAVTAQQETKLLDRISITAHGVPLYNDIPADFFNSYTTYTFGGPNVAAPEDSGALMIPFCLYPGSYQPSGYINVSRAREFYIEYVSSVIDQGLPGELSVLASSLNFLLISDGSAVLRYST